LTDHSSPHQQPRGDASPASLKSVKQRSAKLHDSDSDLVPVSSPPSESSAGSSVVLQDSVQQLLEMKQNASLHQSTAGSLSQTLHGSVSVPAVSQSANTNPLAADDVPLVQHFDIASSASCGLSKQGSVMLQEVPETQLEADRCVVSVPVLEQAEGQAQSYSARLAELKLNVLTLLSDIRKMKADQQASTGCCQPLESLSVVSQPEPETPESCGGSPLFCELGQAFAVCIPPLSQCSTFDKGRVVFSCGTTVHAKSSSVAHTKFKLPFSLESFITMSHVCANAVTCRCLDF